MQEKQNPSATESGAEQDADRAVSRALEELEAAKEVPRGAPVQAGEAVFEKVQAVHGREALEKMAFTPGFNIVADSNIAAEEEQRRVKSEAEARSRAEQERHRQKQEREEKKRAEQDDVENRTYVIGRASVDILADDLVAVKLLREERKKAQERGEGEGEGEEKEDAGKSRNYERIRRPELVVVTEQMMCTTEEQARIFAFFGKTDGGRAVEFNRHATVFAGAALDRLVERDRTALRTEESTDRTLYPYSFGRPSDRLIAALRVTVMLTAEREDSRHEEAGQEEDGERDGSTERERMLVTRESITVVDRAVEVEAQQENNSPAAKERMNRSFVDGPSHSRKEKPIIPLRHVNSLQVVLDMSGRGHTRAKEEQFRRAPDGNISREQE